MNPEVVPSVAATLLLGSLSIHAVVWPAAPPFRGLLRLALLSATAFAVGDLLSQIASDNDELWWAVVLIYSSLMALAASWWALALRYAAFQGKPFPWAGVFWTRLPAVLFSVLWLGLISNPWHGQFLTLRLGERNDYEWLWFVNMACGYSAALAAVVLFATLARRAETRSRRIGALLMCGGTLAPLLANMIYVSWPVAPAFDLTAVGLCVSAALFLGGLYWHQLFNLAPAILAEAWSQDPDPILLLDIDGRARYVNPAAERAFGDSIWSHTVATLAAALRDRGGSKQSVDAGELWSRLSSPAQPPEGHLYAAEPIGWRRVESLLLSKTAEEHRGYCVRVRDVTRLTDLLEDLRGTQERLRLALDTLPAVLWTTDRELRFTSSLGAGLGKLGLAPNQVVGMTLEEYFGGADPSFEPLTRARKALAGEAVDFEIEWQGRAFECHVRPLTDASEKIIGTLGIALDIASSRPSQ